MSDSGWPIDWPEDVVESRQHRNNVCDVLANVFSTADWSSCFICGTKEGDDAVIASACGSHGICFACLRDGVRVAITDESCHPFECDHLPSNEAVESFVDSALKQGPAADRALLEKYQERRREFQVPAPLRTYCANTKCHLVLGESRFLDAGVCGDELVVICADCDEITCRKCKELRADGEAHACSAERQDANIKAYIATLPEEGRWLWQKCPVCGIWVNKSEACNHVTCHCSAQFCLICGLTSTGLNSCKKGCPHYGEPLYDRDGYNQHGFHRETGLDRRGNERDPNFEHEGDCIDDVLQEEGIRNHVGCGDDDHFLDQWYEELRYDEQGFDQYGRDREGYDKDGYNEEGVDRNFRDREGYHSWTGYNELGVDRRGYNRKRMDADGYFEDGYDFDGFDRKGVSTTGVRREEYDKRGLDALGRTPFGYTFDGYDETGYDWEGFDRDGFDENNYNRRGKDREGYDCFGYNQHNRDRNGRAAAGYFIAADGNVQRNRESPFWGTYGLAWIDSACEHNLVRHSTPARCEACCMDFMRFYHRCQDCETITCANCAYRGHRWRRAEIQLRHIWPGKESFGIAEMMEREEAGPPTETLKAHDWTDVTIPPAFAG